MIVSVLIVFTAWMPPCMYPVSKQFFLTPAEHASGMLSIVGERERARCSVRPFRL